MKDYDSYLEQPYHEAARKDKAYEDWYEANYDQLKVDFLLANPSYPHDRDAWTLEHFKDWQGFLDKEWAREEAA